MAFVRLLQPNLSLDEDSRRHQFILNVFLFGSVILSGVAWLVSILRNVLFGDALTSPTVLLVICLFFVVLLIASKRGYFKVTSFVLVGLYLLYALYSFFSWGPDLPQALLISCLVIVMSGILISTRAALGTYLAIAIGLTIITQGILAGWLHPSQTWRQTNVTMMDCFVSLVIFAIILSITWLSNREIVKSLARAHRSEAALKEERDKLELRVEERTQELKSAQIQAMSQVYHFAEFGKLSSGIFHDLVAPMTSLSLNLEQLKTLDQKNLSEMTGYYIEALKASKRMEHFLFAIRRQIQHQEVIQTFKLMDEVDYAVQVLAYRAQKEEVELAVQGKKELTLIGNPLKFNQILINLITNAIDAYQGCPKTDQPRVVELKLDKTDEGVLLTVLDHGSGIPKGQLKQIFEPFYTSKGIDQGVGIGLSIVKGIIEKDFKGKIQVESGDGTTRFLVYLRSIHA